MIFCHQPLIQTDLILLQHGPCRFSVQRVDKSIDYVHKCPMYFKKLFFQFKCLQCFTTTYYKIYKLLYFQKVRILCCICNKHLNDVIVNKPKQTQGGDLIYRIVGIEVLNKSLMQTTISINMLEVLMFQNYILDKSQCMFDQILNYRIYYLYSNLKNQICSYFRARRKWKGASVGAEPEQITLPGGGEGGWILATISDLKFHFDFQFAIFM